MRFLHELHCVFVGYIGELCHVEKDRVPYIYSIEGGEVCVVSDREACEEVHINADFFAVKFNPSFSCRVAVCII